MSIDTNQFSTTTSTSTSTASQDLTVGAFMTEVLVALGPLGVPYTQANLQALVAQSHCEGPAATQGAYNPLNTTYGSFGSNKVPSSIGQETVSVVGYLTGTGGGNTTNPAQSVQPSDPVKNYAGENDGILATAATIIGEPVYLAALKSGQSAQAVAAAIGQARWGTSASCIQSRLATYSTDPSAYSTDANQTVNGGNGTAGNYTGADPGAITPSSEGLPSLSDVTSFLGGFEALLGDLPRVGLFLGGGVLFLLGLAVFTSTTKTGGNITQLGEVAALA
jgi:hypothetical protein